MRSALWTCLFVGLPLAFLLGLCSGASPHDIYTGLQRDGSRASSSPCCGDSDCEPVTYTPHVDGSVTIYSPRWKASVLVAASKITWIAIDDKEAHWCGAKKTYLSAAADDQPDPTYYTYCTFISPGGV